ncbi:UDP-N-acetylmuramoyl-L-alanyl-D-glutamate--2,6-diaminopimelate ligase [Ideonella sp. A 288]|uniref:UDP-N-acetylmuramoyl-L-alanyl-D-glutamate--2, 6-diaminopimelate ligase n=1 Tax=Ideonella sp. A 288 TaxID=1962181 RepID=UPI000B4B2FD1|nr:UDP-N-acetylmuramoyl-L-alanyl-D-glutamate--2,6-diaminopimelate ligase [Ideonella sp. A 288]
MHLLSRPDDAAAWLRQRVRGSLRVDSRQVQPGDGFIAWPGHAVDARRFVRAAIDAGASACLVEADGRQAYDLPDDARLAAFTGLKAATGTVAAAFHGHPGAALSVLAVTGTNGKSSTAWWDAQALTLLQRRCGVVGTLGIGEPPRADTADSGSVQGTGLTTPDPVTLQAALRRMVDDGFSACAIEASSIGIAEHRLAGLPVTVAQFTNFTRDHLDYHHDMAAYWACKRALFDWPGLRAAVVNVDDPQGAALAAELQGRALDLWTVSTRAGARLCAQDVRYVDGGLAFEAIEGTEVQPVRSTLIGDYNASNLLVVLGGLCALGVSLADAVQVVPGLTPVPGRMQPVSVAGAPQPEVVVDYAHTPDALDKALSALRPLAAARGGRLWCVFGCGGNRDATKRPLMGAIAQRGADAVVVTSDNPRDEVPEAILQQIVGGMSAAPAPWVIADRREAIERAVTEAAVADVVLVAGKGHESTQEIAGVRHAFSDVDVALRALRLRGAAC